MLDLIRNEPVIVRNLIASAVALAVVFGLRVTDNQIDQIDVFVVALLTFIGAASARQKVTPVD